jgi:aspartyl-tRNA(Asn)/glutamyl-tRNA(Gln) amidotransferase subunit A
MTCASALLRKKASDVVETHLCTHLAGFSSTSLSGLRIGIPLEMTSTSLPPSAFGSSANEHTNPTPNSNLPAIPQSLLDHLVALGATLHAVSLPSLTRALPAYYVIASAEASSNLARYGGGWFGSSWEIDDLSRDAGGADGETGEERRRRIRTEGFGAEVKKRLLAGTYALSADEFNNTYLKALYLRSLLRSDFARILRIPDPRSEGVTAAGKGADNEQVDVLLHPTAVGTAPILDKASSSEAGADEYAQDVLTVPASLAGLPAISVPAGRAADGWPVGVSLVSQWGAEEIVWGAAEAVEAWARTLER